MGVLDITTRPLSMTPTELNQKNHEFWNVQTELFEACIHDDKYFKYVLSSMQRDCVRCSVYSQKPLQLIFDETENARKFSQSQVGKRGGKRSDALQKCIDKIVARTPDIDQHRLLWCLNALKGHGVVEDVTDTDLTFVATDGSIRDVPLSGLKDRLSRAKKKIRGTR